MDEQAFRAEVVSFLHQAKADGVACDEFGAIMPPDLFDRARVWQRRLFDHGFAGIDWPTEFGGGGLTTAHASVWFVECARAAVAPYMNFQGFVLAGPAIRRFGTPLQKDTFLKSTLAADTVWCQLFSEPGSGSDLVSLTTTAEATDDGWTINGQKVWSSTAHLADYGILLARTNPENRGHGGISFFLIDMRQPGIDIRPIKQMTGDHEFCEVFLTDAHVPADMLLGELHGGWSVATAVLADERAEVGAKGVVLERRLSELAGTMQGAGPVDRDDIMDLLVRGHALNRMLGRVVGEPAVGPLSKLALTEQTSALVNTTIDSLGPGGMLTGPEADAFLYAPGMRVAGGTSEIQRNLVGERLLGLPREPKVR